MSYGRRRPWQVPARGRVARNVLITGAFVLVLYITVVQVYRSEPNVPRTSSEQKVNWPPRDAGTPSIRDCNVSHYPPRFNQRFAEVEKIVNFRRRQKETW